MSVYRSSEERIARELEGYKPEARAEARLTIDLMDLLTGPTSCNNAANLAHKMCENGPKELATRMKEAAERFLATLENDS